MGVLMTVMLDGSETWTLEGQKPRLKAVEMGYSRMAYRVTCGSRWLNESSKR